MYPLFLLISFLHEFRHYFRKHISDFLDHHEYLLLNSLCISFIVAFYLVYLYMNDNLSVSKMMNHYKSMTLVELFCILLLSVITIFSAIIVYELDKNHNTPFLNTLFMKSAGIIVALCVGIFMFEESYKLHQIVGIGMILFGVYLASSKKFDLY
jgi:hypothetical protein